MYNRALRLHQQVEPQALEDAQADVRRNPDSLDALRNAAEVFGYAATLEPENETYRIQGREYLKRALQLGMSRQMYARAKSRLDVLLNQEIEKLLDQAPEEVAYTFDANPPGELPRTADWATLLKAPGSRRP